MKTFITHLTSTFSEDGNSHLTYWQLYLALGLVLCIYLGAGILSRRNRRSF